MQIPDYVQQTFWKILWRKEETIKKFCRWTKDIGICSFGGAGAQSVQQLLEWGQCQVLVGARRVQLHGHWRNRHLKRSLHAEIPQPLICRTGDKLEFWKDRYNNEGVLRLHGWKCHQCMSLGLLFVEWVVPRTQSKIVHVPEQKRRKLQLQGLL